MRLAFRSIRAALFAAGLLLAGVAPAQAQAQPRIGTQDAQDAQDAQGAVGQRAAADPLRGVGRNPEALLGAPAALDDRYRSPYDAAGADDETLKRAERVPRGALAGGRYGAQPAAPAQRPAPRGGPGARNAGEADGNKADPGAQTPLGAALSVYHGSADAGKAAGQVYKMPW